MSSQPSFSDLIGIAFLDLGRDPAKGLDCWGLVLEVMRRLGHTVPDYAVPTSEDAEATARHLERALQGGLWRRLEQHETPHVGDILAMETFPELPGVVSHFGVFIGEGRIIHAIRKHSVSTPKLRHVNLFGKPAGWYRWLG
jgi:cell wall-associated NlpC family hydrolase